MTNPKGSVFVSYRRSRIGETTALVRALHDRGVPTWRDVDSLRNEPTEKAIRLALKSEDTSGAILWITSDVESSNMIKYVEVPLALERFRRDDGFWLIIALVGGAGYDELSKIFDGAIGTEELAIWNVTKINALCASADDVVGFARTALSERLRAIGRGEENQHPLEVSVHAKGTRPSGTLNALAADWTSYFANGSPGGDDWAVIGAAWHDVATTINSVIPASKQLTLTGTPSLPAAILIGSGFSSRDGQAPRWIQRLPDGISFSEWSAYAAHGAEVATEIGWSHSLQHKSPNATALAVLLNLSDDVELAVGNSSSDLPKWRAVLHIDPPRGRNTRSHPLSAIEVASVVHLTIDAVREARQSAQPLASIHLFVAGPAGFGVLLGTQLATLPPVTTYEFDTESQRYIEAARIVT